MNQTRLNNEKSGILWGIRQIFLRVLKMHYVLLVPKYTKWICRRCKRFSFFSFHFGLKPQFCLGWLHVM